MSANISYTRGLPVGTYCITADNSKSKIYQIIGVINVNGVKKRIRSATIGDIVCIVVKVGPDVKKGKVLRGVVVRQKKPIFRKSKGYRISFYDNAIVEIDTNNVVVNTRIKGVVAREAADKIPSLIGKGAFIL
jgi:ribosomal protein L14